MSLPEPLTVMLDPTTGAIRPSTGRYQKRLSDLAGIFHDQAAWETAIREKGDPVVYEVIEVRQPGSDLFFGTTIMAPGQVGEELYMTRGHFHARPDRGEVYSTLSGTGILLLQARDGRTESVPMSPGSVAAIPPDWAHRTINTGRDPLIFSWVCAVDAGNDYSLIQNKGMNRLVLRRDGRVLLVERPG